MSHEPSLPTPPRERWPLAVALAALVAGAALLGVALGGVFTKHSHARLPAPPAAPAVVVMTPAPAPGAAAAVDTSAVTGPATAAQGQQQAKQSPATQKADAKRFTINDRTHVAADWVSGFYGIYAEAQKVYGVNWLLIASVHKQETAFSTHPTTYHGLNFANCCAGPMQFNVTNGPVSTWKRYKDSFARGTRPADYPHKTAKHPSIYDDYDSIMAAAALLRDSGAGRDLDASAWQAAYDYYGHDATGVSYADEVMARAIGWGQKSFCINCLTDSGLMNAVDAAWGAPARTALDAAAAAKDEDAVALAASKKSSSSKSSSKKK
ncbi:MAG TPA: hypothetical protein VFG42_26310 [Baekduia sp.]|uniref:hypothetical protein n=1 Tax=Baekduia sp. TaxID=2600305 RepID=UPI002D791B02|nr:hypothetical protein [Baekduia sp.]HET6510335.1 hypothetical protein [Baekduia sp.]